MTVAHFFLFYFFPSFAHSPFIFDVSEEGKVCGVAG
jgi:hypothetical protein